MAVVLNGTTNDITVNGVSVATDAEVALKSDLSYVNSKMVLKNLILDGRFDFWYEGVSQTTSGYGSDTMWSNGNSGSTKTHSRQSFSLGETFLDGTLCPTHYSRTLVSSVAGANNYVVKNQAIEDVTRLSGKTVTLSFYAKANAQKEIAIEFAQVFGTGGSPSAAITGIGAQKVTLTTTWQKYSVTVTLPSIVGKVLGTNNNHYTGLQFWFDAGSSLNSRTANLGQQSGTFDIALVQVEESPIPTSFDNRTVHVERDLINRYYQRWDDNFYVYGVGAYSGATVTWAMSLSTLMRANPVFSGGWYGGASAAAGAVYANHRGIASSIAATQLNTNYAAFLSVIALDARL